MVKNAEDHVKVGDIVEAKVITFDPNEKRIGLSLKTTEDTPEVKEEKKAPKKEKTEEPKEEAAAEKKAPKKAKKEEAAAE